MTERPSSKDEVAISSQEAAELRKDTHPQEHKWYTDIHNNADDAVKFANKPPVSPPDRIVFHTLANGKVRTYDFR